MSELSPNPSIKCLNGIHPNLAVIQFNEYWTNVSLTALDSNFKRVNCIIVLIHAEDKLNIKSESVIPDNSFPAIISKNNNACNIA